MLSTELHSNARLTASSQLSAAPTPLAPVYYDIISLREIALALGDELAGLTAGIDRLYRSTPRSDGFLDREGLIPVAVADIAPAEIRSYDEAEEKLAVLLERTDAVAETPLRRAYLTEMIDSLMVLVQTFAEKQIGYAERVKRQIRVDAQLVDEATLEGYRTIIRER